MAPVEEEEEVSVDFELFVLPGARKVMSPEYKYYVENRRADKIPARVLKDPELYYFSDGNNDLETIRIEENQRVRGKFQYKGPNPIRFYRKMENIEGEPTFIPVAEARIHPEEKRVILILSPNHMSTGFTVKSIDLDGGEIEKGNAYICNLAAGPVAINIDGNSIYLKPAQGSVVSLSESRGYSVEVKLATLGAENEWGLRHYERLLVDSNRAYLFLVLMNPTSDGFRVVSIRVEDEQSV
ncbi:MAG: hypothetical protein ACQKBT_06930 [Puniceicoccales bacterium]